LLDAELLADVYLELIGGKEPGLKLTTDKQQSSNSKKTTSEHISRKFKEPRNFQIKEDELKNHETFIENKIKDTIWKL
jgi:DNA polymerase-3 subunit epsilon